MASRIAVIIPVLNEEESLPEVLGRIPRNQANRIVVVDNGSTDRSVELARQGGAQVVVEPFRGYGAACLKGIEILRKQPPDAVVFLDGDGSSNPALIPKLVEPLLKDKADLVLGQRMAGLREKGSLLPQARFGNWLATALIRLFWGYRYWDLGPFRAIRWKSLESLGMRDKTWGWTIEMQIKAVKNGLRIAQIPVPYKKRFAGKSKISGTLSGTFKAGWKILYTIWDLFLRPP